MLKIKDNVDLKVLEKFGFTCQDEEYLWLEPSEDICIDIKTRTIEVFGDCDDNGNMSMNILYDLIKADLVEKIGEPQ